MRQSLLVAFAVLALHGASPGGTDVAAASRSHVGPTATGLAWTSGSGPEAAPAPDMAPPGVTEGKREETEEEAAASVGLGAAPAGPHRLDPPGRVRSHASREIAAAVGPPDRPARLRC